MTFTYSLSSNKRLVKSVQFLKYIMNRMLWVGLQQVDPTPQVLQLWLYKNEAKNSSSSSSSPIVHTSAPLSFMTVEAKVMETKGSLSINSAITSSFKILSHAKHQAARWAGGDANSYSLTSSGKSLFSLIDKWKSWNSLHLKWPLARIGGSSPISCLRWEMEKTSLHRKLSAQFRTLQRPFRLHAKNTQLYCSGFKAQIQ